MWIMETTLPGDTVSLGRTLAEGAGERLVIALLGDLGSGKTCFAKGIGEGLGIEEDVVSPTFILVSEYAGRLPLLHADVYRLEAGEHEGIGLEEQLDDWPGLVLVEWADRCEELLPKDHLRIVFEDLGGTHRRLSMEARGPVSAAALERAQKDWESSNRE